MSLSKFNPVEPPWYGPVCPVVWEGWHREVSPYPDPCPIAVITRAQPKRLVRVVSAHPGVVRRSKISTTPFAKMRTPPRSPSIKERLDLVGEELDGLKRLR